jgi:raffinose/stachyose/melibiose transport system permease protein
MSATLISQPHRAAPTPLRASTRRRRRLRRGERPNWVGAAIAWLWLAVVLVPIYWIVITSLKSQANYFATNPLIPSPESNLAQYRFVAKSDFPRYFLNSVIVTVG